MSEPIKPALTPEEWASHYSDGNLGEDGVEEALLYASRKIAECIDSIGPNRHALAALALHGQPFGFGRYDVVMLRDAAAHFAGSRNTAAGLQHLAMTSLAARIEALLPPEPTP